VTDTKNSGSISENPFPGLRPFDVAESHLFFGREHQVDELLRKLTLYHFVSVVGTSGSGKSSLVRAGLLAKLYNGYNIGEGSKWLIAIMRPGANPILNLAKSLFSEQVFGTSKDVRARIDAAVELLNESPLSLIQIIRANIQRGTNILILADQFEELFRFSNESDPESQKHAAHFVQLLIEAVRQHDAGIYVVITLRADFLGDCSAFEGLPEAINDGQYLIPRLNREHYKLVIEGPVNYAHGKIAPRLVQQLLNDMSNNQDQLPILQHSLMRAWENTLKFGVEGDPMDLAQYKAIGTLKHALNQHANEAFAELNEKQKKLAALIFKCITVKGSDNRGIRRPTKFKDICEITRAKDKDVLETLEVFRKSGRGFIMPPADVELLPEMMVDISHESLMRNWKRLEEWVDEEYESAQMYQRLSEAAILYQNGVAGLWRDPELSVALEWKEANNPHEAWAKQYNEDFVKSMRFLDESIEGKERMLAEKKRRRLVTNIIVIIFLLSAGGLSLWALIEQNIAFKSANEAISQKSKAEGAEKTAVKSAAEAEKNFNIAEEQRKKALEQTEKAENQKTEAERQKRLADIQTLQTRIQRNKAQQAKIAAEKSEKKAEEEKKLAQEEKIMADSLRIISNQNEELAKEQNQFAVAHSLAIESSNQNEDKDQKALLALEAYRLNLKNKNDSFDAYIMTALFDADKAFNDRDKYVLKGHAGLVKGLAASSDGKYLASSGDDGKVLLWDMTEAKPKSTEIISGTNEFNSVAFSADNTILAGCSDQKIYIWKVSDLKQKPLILSGHTGRITSLVFGEGVLISGGLDKMIIVESLKDNSLRMESVNSSVISLAYSKTTKMIAVGCEDGSIFMFAENNKDSRPGLLIKERSQVTGLSFNDTGDKIAGAFSDGSLNLYYTNQPNSPLANKIKNRNSGLVQALTGHKSALSAVAFGRGTLLASAGFDRKVKLWQSETLAEPVVFTEHDDWVTSMVMSADGKRIYSGGKDKNIIIYDIDEKDIVNRLKKKVSRNLTPMEWSHFMEGIPYQKTVDSLP